jgi:hypothetical protein
MSQLVIRYIGDQESKLSDVCLAPKATDNRLGTACREGAMNRLMRRNKIGLGSKLVSAAQLVRLLQIDYAGPQRGKGAGSICGDRASPGRSWVPVLLGQTSQASKTKRVPVYERNSLAGISALAIS